MDPIVDKALETEKLDHFWSEMVKMTNPSSMFRIMNKFKNDPKTSVSELREEVYKSKRLKNSKGKYVSFAELQPDLVKQYKKDMKITRKHLLGQKAENFLKIFVILNLEKLDLK